MKPEQFTAWALNELSDEERAQIEALIATSPDDGVKAQEMKNFCQFLGEHLVDDDAALDAERRKALEQLVIDVPPNVTAFDADAEPAKVNGKVVRAKLLEQREQRDGPSMMRWVIGIAACLMFVLVVAGLSVPTYNQVSRKQLVAKESEREAAEYSKREAAFARAGGSESVRVQSATASASESSLMADASSGKAKPSAPLAPLPKAKIQPDPNFALPSDPLLLAGSGALVSSSTGSASKTIEGGQINAPLVDATDALAKAATSVERFRAKIGYDSSSAPKPRGEHSYAERGYTTQDIKIGNSDSYTDKDVKLTWVQSVRIESKTNTERYGRISENKFFDPAHDPLSTFSIDVDSASYANVRRFLNEGRLPPPDAVRLEELVNYFPYDYEAPAKDSVQPFSVQVDVAEAPWESTHRLARIGIKGREVGMERQQANFVFLVDVSGSMGEPNKMPLLKRSLLMLTEQIKDDDRVSIVTYAGECGLALESTSGKDRKRIAGVVNSLHTGGSTNGASGIEMAYEQAQKNFIGEGINRVILCTDGDFNVGVSSPDALEKLIKEKAKGGVFLSVLGFGTGNLKDQTMETLADKGNGNYAYIDSLSEARKVLVEQMSGTLITIAKDVKIQVEFNPAQVRSYRLLGYENRVMAKDDFNNDRKDAGEIGAGHTVTALYEIVPMDAPIGGVGPLVDDLKYRTKPEKTLPQMTGVPPQKKLEGINDEMLTVKLRYKEPDGQVSKLIEVPLRDTKKTLKDSPRDFQFAAAVAGFGLKLRDSEHVGELSWETVRKLALSGKGDDKLGYRGEFVQLVDKANGMK